MIGILKKIFGSKQGTVIEEPTVSTAMQQNAEGTVHVSSDNRIDGCPSCGFMRFKTVSTTRNEAGERVRQYACRKCGESTPEMVAVLA